MRLFHRRDAPPASVLARLPTEQRVVSWADAAGGAVLLATPAGLWWPEDAEHRLIGWQFISKATWRDGTLRVVEADVVDDLLVVDRAAVSAELDVPRDLPPVVRARVEANVVHSHLLELLPGGSARFVARRIPGRDGLQWWARLEDGTRDTPGVRAAVADRLAVLRAEHEARD